MDKITDYKVVEAASSQALEQFVEQQIFRGWQPIGGVSYAVQGSRHVYIQAVVKYEKPHHLTEFK